MHGQNHIKSVSMFTLYGVSYNGTVSVRFSVKVICVTAEIPSGNATGHYDENKMGERVRTIHYLRKNGSGIYVHVIVGSIPQG